MNPAFGLGELNKKQLRVNGTYFMLGLTFRMRSNAVLASAFWVYIRYAAAIVALRPAMHEAAARGAYIWEDTHSFRPDSGQVRSCPYRARLV